MQSISKVEAFLLGLFVVMLEQPSLINTRRMILKFFILLPVMVELR